VTQTETFYGPDARRGALVRSFSSWGPLSFPAAVQKPDETAECRSAMPSFASPRGFPIAGNLAVDFPTTGETRDSPQSLTPVNTRDGVEEGSADERAPTFRSLRGRGISRGRGSLPLSVLALICAVHRRKDASLSDLIDVRQSDPS